MNAREVLGANGLLARQTEHYEVRDEQLRMAALVEECIENEGHAVIEAGTGVGKALDIETPIPTSEGFKRMGDIVIGDTIYDERGLPTTVTATYSVMLGRPCYEVVFSDGSTIVADADHLWATLTRQDRRYLAKRGSVVGTLATTQRLRETLYVGRHANHSIAICKPVVYPEQDLPIEPYTLGAWLGNGTSINRHITTADAEIVSEMAQDGYDITPVPSNPGCYALDLAGSRATSRWCDGFKKRLRGLELINAKHIPEIYLHSSVAQRRALLAGLLDTDGTVSHCGGIQYDSTDQALAYDVQTLACSLGYRATLRKKRAGLNGKDCGACYTVQFTTPDPVFHLERKAETHRQRLTRYTHARNCQRFITDVRQVASRPVRCIAVDSPSHLYLAGRTYIPTHNSFAYLIPAILSGKQTIISTANRTLQAQLIGKDLPRLKAVLPMSFSFTVAKGKANYLCADKVQQVSVSDNAIGRWILETRSGDIDEAPRPLTADEGRALCAGDDCMNKKCPCYHRCFYYQAKEARHSADIVVTNHALLCMHAAYPEAEVLPQAPVLIVDEAHQLEAYAVNSQSAELSPFAFRGPASDLRGEGEQFLSRLAGVGDSSADETLIHPLAEYRQGLELAEAIEGRAAAIEPVEAPWDAPVERQRTAAKNAALQAELVSLAKRLRQLSSPTQPGSVRHAMQRNGHPVAKITHFDVSGFLALLASRCPTVIYTSATLATAGADPFAYFRAHHGVPGVGEPTRAARTLQVGSPFDYPQQARLYLPTRVRIPEPTPANRERFDEFARIAAKKLIEASRGGALCLFTSHAAMNAAADYLTAEIEYPVRRQGELGKGQLVQWLRETPGAVLCATASFWEGVDIQGPALRLVVIDKLPFASPGPVELARQRQAGERAFIELSVPEATLRLKQGFGRLIRSKSDYGVVAILDPRLWTKPYGRLILRALPPAQVVEQIDELAAFYRVGRERADEATGELVRAAMLRRQRDRDDAPPVMARRGPNPMYR